MCVGFFSKKSVYYCWKKAKIDFSNWLSCVWLWSRDWERGSMVVPLVVVDAAWGARAGGWVTRFSPVRATPSTICTTTTVSRQLYWVVLGLFGMFSCFQNRLNKSIEGNRTFKNFEVNQTCIRQLTALGNRTGSGQKWCSTPRVYNLY